jgi:transposase InsO family protein
MGSIHHANAKTTVRIRKEIQDSEESISTLAAKYNLNPKTIMKWKHAGRACDKTNPRSRSLTETEEQMICEFRKKTLLPLDDVYTSLKDAIPRLTRSNLHRCLVRYGLNRLPDGEGETPKDKKKFKEYPPGFVHVDITEVRTEEGKLYMFVGVDRATRYVYLEVHSSMTAEVSVSFLKNLYADCPFKITKILTDNGAQFTYALLAEHLRPKDKDHPFDAVCKQLGIEHRLTQFRHPWTNGMVEIRNKLIKNHTTRRYHYTSAEELKTHLMSFLLHYNIKRKLRVLNYNSPYDKILEHYDKCPGEFKENPHHKIMGLNTCF